jgi:hypothetical protein
MLHESSQDKGEVMVLRKGQKLCNWILTHGYTNETVHAKLFNMTDEEFDNALKEQEQKSNICHCGQENCTFAPLAAKIFGDEPNKKMKL